MNGIDQFSPQSSNLHRLYGSDLRGRQNQPSRPEANVLGMLSRGGVTGGGGGAMRIEITAPSGIDANQQRNPERRRSLEGQPTFRLANNNLFGSGSSFQMRSSQDGTNKPSFLSEPLGAKAVLTPPVSGPNQQSQSPPHQRRYSLAGVAVAASVAQRFSPSRAQMTKESERPVIKSLPDPNPNPSPVVSRLPDYATQPMGDDEWGSGIVVTSRGFGSPSARTKKNRKKGGPHSAESSIADVRRYFNVKVKHMLALQTDGQQGPLNAPSAGVNSAIALVGGGLVSVPPRQAGAASAAASQAMLFGSAMQNTQHVAVEGFNCGFCGFFEASRGSYMLLLDARYHADRVVEHCPMCGMYQGA